MRFAKLLAASVSFEYLKVAMSFNFSRGRVGLTVMVVMVRDDRFTRLHAALELTSIMRFLKDNAWLQALITVKNVDILTILERISS